MHCHRLLALLLLPALAGAQAATTRWSLSWDDGSYRIVNGEHVPTGLQTFVLSVAPTRGDSVFATLPTSNPAITDTLDGVLRAGLLSLNARPRTAIARRSDDVSAPISITFRMTLELTIAGTDATGTLVRTVNGLPGQTEPSSTSTPVRGVRLP